MENKFSWTEEFKKTWENEEVDADKWTFKVNKTTSLNRKLLIRKFYLIIDVSNSIERADYIPNIRTVISDSIKIFEDDFIQSNPLSSLEFLTFNDTIRGFSTHYNSLLLNQPGTGNFSIVNLAATLTSIFKSNFLEKEVLIITSSTSTGDSENVEIFDEVLQESNVKINIINLAGEVTIFKKICEKTNGKLFVPLNVEHFKSILNSFIIPIENLNNKTQILKVGFPDTLSQPMLCTCHAMEHEVLYKCPLCTALVCKIPSQCNICNLQLISPLSILMNYFYLDLALNFKETKINKGKCKLCGCTEISSKCEDCNNTFCNSCSCKIVTTLSFCPFCN